ncbi:DUF3885 domain-containing protein [Bacillus velezensis]|uniref:DUF3885 domain-containing protein n=1 Tax=Bacillus velezensis TaxID=492670 RepID=UPI0011246BF1|nr:DUF3885 domain-containing protein [Bacillus velezensis]TNU30658.1 DUF3885 domain-containing protein [Bacillus velezensis]
MKINDYLKERFPTLKLVPGIYHQWDVGLHFSLGGNMYQFNESGALNLEYFQLVHHQTAALFNELFEHSDDMFLVANVYKHKTQGNHPRKLKVYQPFLKCKDDLYRIQVKTCLCPFEEDDAEEYEMQQFSLLCKRKDLRIPQLLKAAVHEDFPLKPRFGGCSVGYPDVFFVNMTKDIIFFLYDDRGCEVIALDAGRIGKLYDQYHDWIELD